MKLADLITPEMPAGTALFLQWDGYHVFSIPQRELVRADDRVRFFGVGGKRQAQESLIECALRESTEEIGAVVSQLESATQTYFLAADGSLKTIDLADEIRPRLILEKRQHSSQSSMAQDASYYLVAFNARLSGKPVPSNEIAGILYLTDVHLSLIRRWSGLTMADMLSQGAQIDVQPHQAIHQSRILIPHGTAKFLIQQLPA
ncbi:MAG: NUDIX domain-containing protein [Leptolyngbya sp. IPPAS B-1204]